MAPELGSTCFKPLASVIYRHKQANRLADEQHQKKNKAIKLTDSVKNYISEKLKEYWSPEQIMGRLELDKKIKISKKMAELKKVA
jgi:IS30 family transposase